MGSHEGGLDQVNARWAQAANQRHHGDSQRHNRSLKNVPVVFLLLSVRRWFLSFFRRFRFLPLPSSALSGSLASSSSAETCSLTSAAVPCTWWDARCRHDKSCANVLQNLTHASPTSQGLMGSASLSGALNSSAR